MLKDNPKQRPDIYVIKTLANLYGSLAFYQNNFKSSPGGRQVFGSFVKSKDELFTQRITLAQQT